jgi:hypothetical protein
MSKSFWRWLVFTILALLGSGYSYIAYAMNASFYVATEMPRNRHAAAAWGLASVICFAAALISGVQAWRHR